ncbi:LOB domain-containing protein 42-like [Andrographis paniculata]|uniref:LOB domain-containing protein 42-like n=1 Tax=Andrographis paniculata TaxID=175694 RepID=UPI0021E8E164|nr:LOB domain-containing protein 42-like [Andrographis paniculata]
MQERRRRSCNGCKALRQACSGDCTIRPCLQWIRSPQSQANATRFLSKFYGRAGLLNLITSGPAHLRPEIFKSLLHEACGRIINPINGSVGLLRSSDWPRCEAAVEAVLRGAPLAGGGGDIRHRVRTRNRIRQSAGGPNKRGDHHQNQFNNYWIQSESNTNNKFTITGTGWDHLHPGRAGPSC